MLAYAPPRESARKSPSTLTIVIALHGAGLAALMLAKPDMIPAFVPQPPTVVRNIPLPPPPEPELIEPDTPKPQIAQSTPLPTPPKPLVTIPLEGPPPIVTDSILDVEPPAVDVIPDNMGGGTTTALVRTEARLKTSPSRLKPDYPPSKRRLGEEATLRMRLDVDAAGRVTRVTPLGEYDPVFFAAAERHILKHWRYEPATLGGDAIADDTVVSLKFTLED